MKVENKLLVSVSQIKSVCIKLLELYSKADLDDTMIIKVFVIQKYIW